MLTLHILSLGFVLGVSALADKEVLAWIRGKKDTLESVQMRRYHTMIWLGLIGLIVTGLYLLWPMRAYLLGNILFDAKMLFVGVLVVNAILIGRLMDLALSRSFTALSRHERQTLFLSGAISVFSWCATAAIALWIF